MTGFNRAFWASANLSTGDDWLGHIADADGLSLLRPESGLGAGRSFSPLRQSAWKPVCGSAAMLSWSVWLALPAW